MKSFKVLPLFRGIRSVMDGVEVLVRSTLDVEARDGALLRKAVQPGLG